MWFRHDHGVVPAGPVRVGEARGEATRQLVAEPGGEGPTVGERPGGGGRVREAALQHARHEVETRTEYEVAAEGEHAVHADRPEAVRLPDVLGHPGRNRVAPEPYVRLCQQGRPDGPLGRVERAEASYPRLEPEGEIANRLHVPAGKDPPDLQVAAAGGGAPVRGTRADRRPAALSVVDSNPDAHRRAVPQRGRVEIEPLGAEVEMASQGPGEAVSDRSPPAVGARERVLRHNPLVQGGEIARVAQGARGLELQLGTARERPGAPGGSPPREAVLASGSVVEDHP